MLFAGKDTVGEFLRETLAPTLVYTARVAPQIAHSIDDVDRAMQWGFGWELGPFELFDAIGVREAWSRPGAGATRWTDGVPPLVASARAGRNRFRDAPLAPAAPGLQILRTAKEQRDVVQKNAGASLVDLGDGVLCRRVPLEDERDRRRHPRRCCRPASRRRRELRGAGRRQRRAELLRRRQPDAAPARSAGRQLGRDRPDGPRRSSGATMALRYAPVPVVVGPGRPGARRRLRDRAARRSRAGGGRNLHGPRRGRRRADSRRRRHEGDAGARGRTAAAPADRSAARTCSGSFETIGFAQGVGQRAGCGAARLPRDRSTRSR